MVRVEDAVSAYVFYHYTQKCRGICNVVGENGVTGRMFAESVAGKLRCKVESMTMKEAEESYGSMCTMVMSMNNQADNSKAQRGLGWTPQYTSFSNTT